MFGLKRGGADVDDLPMADVSRAVPFRSATPTAVPGSDLAIGVDELEDAVVLQLHGVLTAAAAASLRVALQEQFAAHALPVVCDLVGLQRIDSTAVGVFHTAAADCGGWPIVALALARLRSAVASQLRKSGAGKFLVIADTVSKAADAALAGPRTLRDSIELTPATALVDGRRFAADCCLRWLVPELLE